MSDFHIVPIRLKEDEFSPRVNVVTREERKSSGGTFLITKDINARDGVFFETSITKNKFYTINASLSYEITPPNYSSMVERYTEFAQSCQNRIDEIKKRFTDTKYVWEDSSINNEEIDGVIVDKTNYFITQKEINTQRPLTEQAKDKVKYLQDIKDRYEATASAWSATGAEMTRKYGYGVLLTVVTGELGCDVGYLRLNSSRGVVMSVSVIPHLASNKVIKYEVNDFKMTAAYALLLKNRFEETEVNKNYLSRQIFHVIDIVKEPDIYYWIELSTNNKSWLKAKGTDLELTSTSASVNGVMTARVYNITPIVDPEGVMDRATIVVVTESGSEYTGEVGDYSNIKVGDVVNLSKNGNSLTLTSDGEKVKIDNGVGTNSNSLTTVLWEVVE